MQVLDARVAVDVRVVALGERRVGALHVGVAAARLHAEHLEVVLQRQGLEDLEDLPAALEHLGVELRGGGRAGASGGGDGSLGLGTSEACRERPRPAARAGSARRLRGLGDRLRRRRRSAAAPPPPGRRRERAARGRPVLHPAGQQQAQERALGLLGVERDELQDLARRRCPVDAREEVALGQRERALLGQGGGGHEALVEVAEGRAHGLGVAQPPHRLEDEGLGRAGRLRHVGRRVARPPRRWPERPRRRGPRAGARGGRRGGGAAGGAGFGRLPSGCRSPPGRARAASGRVVGARHGAAGQRRGDRTQADDLSVAQQDAQRRLRRAEREDAAPPLPVETGQEGEWLRRFGGVVHGRADRLGSGVV